MATTTSMGMTSGGVEKRVVQKLWSGIAIFIVAVCIAAQPIRTFAQSAADAPGAQTGTVRVDAGHAINSFDPDSALGSSIDVLSRTRHRYGLLAAYYSGIAFGGMGADHLSQQHRTTDGGVALDGKRVLERCRAPQRIFYGQHGTEGSRSDTFWRTRCRIGVSRPAATARCKGRI